MQGKASTQLCLIELLAKPAHKYNRKFQTFALVNTHNAHGIIRFRPKAGFSVIDLIAFQALNIANEMIQSTVAGRFIRNRLFNEHIQIGFPLPSGRKRSRIGTVACDIQNLPQKQVYWRIGRFLPKILHLPEKRIQRQPQACIFPIVTVGYTAVIKSLLF